MAKYLVLIYEDEASWTGAGPEDFDRTYKEHTAFGENNAAALLGGDALHPTSTATSIRKDSSGDFLVTDGPFVETKEVICDYYLIEAADLDEAIAVGKQVPAPYGGVEVRPVQIFE
ncbi:YciI family protein [Sphaerisporangium perillae]|uniref:YciI family protein n=1 Tax=Sphaerisporangium perillae TaxID=2935860 RepID=UPI00200F7870|nr:YciI family protein [Sphaerisporangium perillae]